MSSSLLRGAPSCSDGSIASSSSSPPNNSDPIPLPTPSVPSPVTTGLLFAKSIALLVLDGESAGRSAGRSSNNSICSSSSFCSRLSIFFVLSFNPLNNPANPTLPPLFISTGSSSTSVVYNSPFQVNTSSPLALWWAKDSLKGTPPLLTPTL